MQRITFTSWREPKINLKLVEYIVWQKELCPQTKLEHYQGYVEFKRGYTLGTIKTIFKSKEIHIELARESREVNRLYCTKNQSYANKRFEYGGQLDTGIFDELDDVFNLK